MKFLSLTLICCCLIISLQASQNRKVLLIGIDGVRSDALQQANTPNIDALLGNSLYSYSSWHTGITISGPSWATILTGVQFNKHLILDNDFDTTDFNNYPAFPKRAKEIYPNLKCVEVVEWPPLADEFYNSGWDKKIKVPDTQTFITADSAVAQLQDPDIDVLFAYFDKVDITGHFTTFDPNNPLYIDAIEQVDTGVGKVLNALYARPDYANENWLILLITDHGGSGFLHGGNSLAERHIWWIASGSVIAPRQITKADPGTYNCNLDYIYSGLCVNDTLMKQAPTHPDIAVTALHHLIYESGINPEAKPEWAMDGKSWLAIPTAVNDVATDSDIRILPNPTQGEIDIWCKPDVEYMELRVVDILGKEVRAIKPNWTNNKLRINLAGNAPGIYFIHITSGDRSIVKKVELLR